MIAIETRYLGPTNTKPSRIVASTPNGQRIVRSYGHGAADPYAAVAVELANSMGWLKNGARLAMGGTKRGSVFVFVYPDTYETALS